MNEISEVIQSPVLDIVVLFGNLRVDNYYLQLLYKLLRLICSWMITILIYKHIYTPR